MNAAISMALYLYMNEHDEESHTLTIKNVQRSYTPWSSKIYNVNDYFKSAIAMKKFKFTIRGNNYDVELLNFEDNIAKVEVNGTKYSVEVHKEVKQSKTPVLVRQAVPSPIGVKQK